MGASILYIALPFASVLAAAFLRHAFEMRRENKYREMCGSIFWAGVPFGITSLLWARIEEPAMYAQNFTLGLFGAIIGASALIWAGYVVRGSDAQAQTTISGAKPQVDISGGDNVVSIGQIGGITARVVNINPPAHPELRILGKTETDNPDGSHTVTIKTEVASPTTPGLLSLQINSAGIQSVNIITPNGVSMVNLQNKRWNENLFYAEIPGPGGQYDIIIRTASAVPISLNAQF